MDQNHLQGTVDVGIRYGLEYNGKIVSAIGLKKINKNEKYHENGFTLQRFANTNVTGAFKKLLSYFEKQHNPTSIKTFADLEIVDANNNIYLRNGFIKCNNIRPDYTYYNPSTKRREHKFGWRKNKFVKLGLDVTGRYERQLAMEYGLVRCYDSGKISYIKKY